MRIGRHIVSGHQFDQRRAERYEQGVRQSGAMHSDDDVTVGGKSQLIADRKSIELDASDAHGRVVTSDVRFELVFVSDLTANDGGGITWMRDVIVTPDEQDGNVGTVYRAPEVDSMATQHIPET